MARATEQMTPPSDADLVRQVLSGARARYSLLVQRHQDRLYRYALGMLSDRRTAALLIEHTFVDAYAALRECAPRDRFGAWIFRRVRARCLEHLQHNPGEEPGDEASGPEPPPSALQEALQMLPDPEEREAFLLKHVEGLSYEEMAELLESPKETVRRRVQLAREKLWIDPSKQNE